MAVPVQDGRDGGAVVCGKCADSAGAAVLQAVCFMRAAKHRMQPMARNCQELMAVVPKKQAKKPGHRPG